MNNLSYWFRVRFFGYNRNDLFRTFNFRFWFNSSDWRFAWSFFHFLVWFTFHFLMHSAFSFFFFKLLFRFLLRMLFVVFFQIFLILNSQLCLFLGVWSLLLYWKAIPYFTHHFGQIGDSALRIHFFYILSLFFLENKEGW